MAANLDKAVGAPVGDHEQTRLRDAHEAEEEADELGCGVRCAVCGVRCVVCGAWCVKCVVYGSPTSSSVQLAPYFSDILPPQYCAARGAHPAEATHPPTSGAE